MVKTVNASPVLCAMKGIFASIITSVVLIPLTAWAISFCDDPRILISVTPKIISILSSLIGGIVCSKTDYNRSVAPSIICGTILFVTYATVSLILESGIIAVPLWLISTILPAFLGSIIGKPNEKSGKAKRRAIVKRLSK